MSSPYTISLQQLWEQKIPSSRVLLLQNLPEDINSELLTNYLEVVCQDDVQAFYFPRQAGSLAVVVFQTGISDFDSVVEKMTKKKPLNLQACPLSTRACGIFLMNLPAEVSQDYLEIYFENRKSGGQEDCVEEARLHRDKHLAIVVFAPDLQDSVLDAVLRRQHTITSRTKTHILATEPYFPAYHDLLIELWCTSDPGEASPEAGSNTGQVGTVRLEQLQRVNSDKEGSETEEQYGQRDSQHVKPVSPKPQIAPKPTIAAKPVPSSRVPSLTSAMDERKSDGETVIIPERQKKPVPKPRFAKTASHSTEEEQHQDPVTHNVSSLPRNAERREADSSRERTFLQKSSSNLKIFVLDEPGSQQPLSPEDDRSQKLREKEPELKAAWKVDEPKSDSKDYSSAGDGRRQAADSSHVSPDFRRNPYFQPESPQGNSMSQRSGCMSPPATMPHLGFGQSNEFSSGQDYISTERQNTSHFQRKEVKYADRKDDESRKPNENSSKTERKCNLRKEQIVLLKINCFSKKATGCSIQLDEKACNITLRGSEGDVQASVLKMYETLDTIHEVSEPVPENTARILTKAEALNVIRNRIRKQKIYAFVDAKGKQLYCWAFTESEARQGLKFATDTLEESHVQLREEQMVCMEKPIWFDTVVKLEDQFKPIGVTYVEAEKKVSIMGLNADNVHKCRRQVLSFLWENTPKKSLKLTLTGAKARCFKASFESKLTRGNKGVQVKEKADRGKEIEIVVTGNDSAISAVQDCVSKIWHEKVDFRKIGSDDQTLQLLLRGLASSRGPTFIEEMERMWNCFIEIQKGSDREKKSRERESQEPSPKHQSRSKQGTHTVARSVPHYHTSADSKDEPIESSSAVESTPSEVDDCVLTFPVHSVSSSSLMEDYVEPLEETSYKTDRERDTGFQSFFQEKAPRRGARMPYFTSLQYQGEMSEEDATQMALQASLQEDTYSSPKEEWLIDFEDTPSRYARPTMKRRMDQSPNPATSLYYQDDIQLEDPMDNDLPTSIMINSTKIKVEKGDITKTKADILVNILGPDFTFENSAVSKSFVKSGGRQLVQMFENQKSQMKANCSTILTAHCGFLHCQFIAHVGLQKKPRNTEQVVCNAVRECVQHCRDRGCTSIAFPPLGCGRLYRYSTDDVARWMLLQIQTDLATGQNPRLKEVKFVVYDRSVYNDFRSTLQQHEDGSLKPLQQMPAFVRPSYLGPVPQPAQRATSFGQFMVARRSKMASLSQAQQQSNPKTYPPKVSPPAPTPVYRTREREIVPKRQFSDPRPQRVPVDTSSSKSVQQHHKTLPMIVVRVYAENRAVCTTAKNRIENQMKVEFLHDQYIERKGEIPDKAKAQISQLIFNKGLLRLKGNKPNCYVIRGQKDAVLEVEKAIYQILLNCHRTEAAPTTRARRAKLQRKTKEFCKFMAIEEQSEVPTYWENFHPGELIQTAFSKVLLKLKSKKHMKETLRPDCQAYKIIEYMISSTWEQNKVGQGKDAANLQSLQYSRIVVTKIQRIENLEMYQKFCQAKINCFKSLYKKEMTRFQPIDKGIPSCTGPVATKKISGFLRKDMHSEVNEHFFFHGTKADLVSTICDGGLDSRLGNDKAMFGPGVYGAESSTKADQYTDERDQRSAQGKTMFLIRMIMGNAYVCSDQNPPKYRRPPCATCRGDRCTQHSELFDSVVGDNGKLFREFVVYNPDQCYPEYLITYDRQ